MAAGLVSPLAPPTTTTASPLTATATACAMANVGASGTRVQVVASGDVQMTALSCP
jgi:hypothetical protein